MSIESTEVNVLEKTITVTFYPIESDDFSEIINSENNQLTISIETSGCMPSDLEECEVKLEFPLIQIIKLLSESDQYFLKAVTTLDSIVVIYTITDMTGGGAGGDFYAKSFEIHFTNCLLINGSIENEQIIPIKSNDLLYSEDEILYIKLNNCLTADSVKINIENL